MDRSLDVGDAAHGDGGGVLHAHPDGVGVGFGEAPPEGADVRVERPLRDGEGGEYCAEWV